jgi:hypothetical protein
MRRWPAIFAFALLLSACGAGDPFVDDDGGSRAGTPPGGRSGPGTAGETSGGGSGGSAARYDDDGALGSMVRAYLRAEPATKLIVEVDYVSRRAPSSRALAHLASVLEGVADKPGGIDVKAGNEIAAGRDTWSIGEIKALERQHRAARSSGDTATMWIVYLDGRYASEESALGVAYSASAAAIFRDRIGDATTALVDASSIERAVVVHEAGHILALINIGYTSAIDHEDPDHPHHSKNKGSVMYYAVEDVSIANLLGGGPPATFDDADKADLAKLKSG